MSIAFRDIPRDVRPMAAKASTVKQRMDDQEKRELNAVLGVLDAFRKVDPTMSLHTASALILVALEEGTAGVGEYAKRAEVATSVMTRDLLDLGARNRKLEPGHGLVTQRPDPMNLRATQTFLTDKGVALLHRVLRAFRTISRG